MVTSFYHGEKNHYGFFTQVSNLILQSTNQISKKDLSITQPSNPIQSNPPTPAGARMGTDGMGAREAYREVILENIGYEYLIEDPKMDREQLDEISKPLIFLSRFAKSVRVQLADIHHAAHKNLPVDQSRPPGEREIKNAATPRKRACSGAFGTPGETRTHYIPLRSLAFLLVRYTHHNFPLFLIRYDIVWLLVNLHKNPSNAASLWPVQNVKLANS